MANEPGIPAFLRRGNADSTTEMPVRTSRHPQQRAAYGDYARSSDRRSRSGQLSPTPGRRSERIRYDRQDRLAERDYRSERSRRRAASDDFAGIGRASSWGGSSALYTEEDILDELERDGELEERASRGRTSRQNSRSQRKSSRSKARAEKMFNRQFGSAEGQSEADGAPRAAVYEGRMGSSHRRAARMQGNPSQRGSAASGIVGSLADSASSAVSSASITPRTLKVFTAVICFVLMCAFLYTPTQQFYHAQREHARLEVEYATIENRNDALDVQNDILASQAGMEDSVRQKFGYVKTGEQTAIVTGLSDNATDTSRDSEGIEANVLSSSVKAPEEWYTPILDALFGVE